MLSLLCAGLSVASLSVSNFADGETVRYPVVLIEGGGASQQITSTINGRTIPGDTHQGSFKVLAELRPGANTVTLKSGENRRELKLRYAPATTQHKVNVVYVTAADGDTAFQSPFENDPLDYRTKLDTAVKLMQCFTAESMRKQGWGRMTFTPEFDANGKVVVHTIRYPMDPAILRKRTGNDLWGDFYDWIDRQFPMSHRKNLVVIGFSRWDPEKQQAMAHTALGGGGMALFSNAPAWAWPTTLSDVVAAFQDPAAVDTTRVTDDSGLRGTRWATAATTIGAMLHELGHSFGLPHTGDPLSIMTRGFDRFNRAFTFSEPSRKGGTATEFFTEESIAKWEERSAAQLAFSRWFQVDRREYDDTPPQITVSGSDLVVEAKNGLGSAVFMPHRDDVEGDNGYKAFKVQSWKEGPKQARFAISALAEENKAAKRFWVVVTDRDGNTTEYAQP